MLGGMAARFVVLFECAPAQSPPWVRQVCDALKLTLIDNDAVAGAMPPGAADVFVAPDLQREDPRLAPSYAQALESVSRGAERIALQSSSWLVYGQQPAAVVVDFDAAIAAANGGRAREEGGPAAAAAYLEDVKRQWRARLSQHVEARRVLELPLGTPHAEKVALATAHLAAFEGDRA